MQSKATTVAQYLAELPADRRAAIAAVRKMLRANLDKRFKEGMQCGMISYYVPHSLYPPGYHCDPAQPLCFVGLASQKNYMSLYLSYVYSDLQQAQWFQQAWAKTGKKLNMGKCCVRFKKVDDLALDVIAEAVRRTSIEKHIKTCEAAIQRLRKARAKPGVKKRRLAAKPKVAAGAETKRRKVRAS